MPVGNMQKRRLKLVGIIYEREKNHKFQCICGGKSVTGDVVNIPPEVKHWHGAADSWFSHLAVEVVAEGDSNEWLEAVSDEEYGKLK